MNLELLNRLKNSSHLPSIPAVAIRVLELAKQADAKVGDIVKVISSDPALSAKVLQTVNSSFYGLPNRVSTISQSLVLLGMGSVKTLALGFSLASSLNSRKSSTFDYTRFWRQSLFSAVAARTLAKRLRNVQAEEAFLAGLLSDIGTLVMHRALAGEYDALLQECEGNQIKLVRRSREKFDLDHAQVGGMLAEHWKLPPALVKPIRQHHDPDGETHSPLVEVVYVGVLCGQVFAAKVPGLLHLAQEELCKRFKLPATDIRSLLAEIEEQTKQLAELFEVNISDGRRLHDIEQEARDTLLELTLQTQAHSKEIQEENEQLQEQATTDALTGLPNRARFDQFIAQAFSESSMLERPLAVLFLDVDKFKSVNDTYGHQAGDLVLARLGTLLKSKVQEPHLAARYGGEELAIILKGNDTAAAMRTAEEIRRAIMTERFTFEEKTIPVTASIGVAAYDPTRPFKSPSDLIGAADRSVYVAKASGRNCVRAHIIGAASPSPIMGTHAA